MPIPASAYANLALVPPRPAAKTTTHARQLEAVAERDRELHLKRKIDQANDILDRLEARGVAQGIQLKALQRRKAATLARIERIEDRILGDMLDARLDNLNGLQCSMSLRQNAASLMIDDEALIPEEYVRSVVTTSPDKLAIKAAIADNIAVPGCHLEQSVSLIRK